MQPRGERKAGSRSRLVVLSNRLPFTVARRGQNWRAQPGSGGLVSALLPALRRAGGTWIGWNGAGSRSRGSERALAEAGAAAGCRLEGLALSAAELRAYYLGFSNQVLWPLFHDLPSLCRFEPEYWRAYVAVNRKFARAAGAHAGRGDLVWVHDYQLMMVGAELRRLGNRAGCAFFLHIPFPGPDVFLKLPWRAPLLDALLAYDQIGFQTARDLRNFAAAARALGKAVRVQRGAGLLVGAGERGASRAGHFPISIDFREFARGAADEDVAARAAEIRRRLPERKLVLGIDRLDYAKGITLRLRAFQSLLERHPEMRGRVSLLQVVVPSREDVPQYALMKREIEQLAGRINGAFARPGGWVPVWYEYRHLSQAELLAYYRAAEIALVTPLKDGMNLVAKEYCACSVEEDGVLILSEFAGAAEQLGGGALLVNPHDFDGVADAIRAACTMPHAERMARMRAMRRGIRRQDVFHWTGTFLRAAGFGAAARQGAARRASGRRAPEARQPA